MNHAYQMIRQQCKEHAKKNGWRIEKEGAHLGWFSWKEEPWWKDMKSYIQDMDVSMYPVESWDWVDQCDIGIDYFNQYLLRHRPPHPIFKEYLVYRLANERLQASE
jgi:hypothetical protein